MMIVYLSDIDCLKKGFRDTEQIGVRQETSYVLYGILVLYILHTEEKKMLHQMTCN